jgi:hypothetical protein
MNNPIISHNIYVPMKKKKTSLLHLSKEIFDWMKNQSSCGFTLDDLKNNYKKVNKSAEFIKKVTFVHNFYKQIKFICPVNVAHNKTVKMSLHTHTTVSLLNVVMNSLAMHRIDSSLLTKNDKKKTIPGTIVKIAFDHFPSHPRDVNWWTRSVRQCLQIHHTVNISIYDMLNVLAGCGILKKHIGNFEGTRAKVKYESSIELCSLKKKIFFHINQSEKLRENEVKGEKKFVHQEREFRQDVLAGHFSHPSVTKIVSDVEFNQWVDGM